MLSSLVVFPTEQFSCVPYVATALSCACWIIFTRVNDLGHNITLLCISCIGLVVELVYVSLYWYHGERVNKRPTMIAYIGGGVALFAVFGIFTLVCPKNAGRKTFVGLYSTASSIGMYASPLSIVWEVIETRSAQYLPILTTLMTCTGLLCGAV